MEPLPLLLVDSGRTPTLLLHVCLPGISVHTHTNTHIHTYMHAVYMRARGDEADNGPYVAACSCRGHARGCGRVHAPSSCGSATQVRSCEAACTGALASPSGSYILPTMDLIYPPPMDVWLPRRQHYIRLLP